MSTYTDLHNKTKETINVDYHTRVTPQKALFLNPENIYWGKFEGQVDASNIKVESGTLNNISVDGAVLKRIKFENGIDLDKIAEDIATMKSAISSQDEADKKLSTAIEIEELNRTNADNNIVNSLSTQIELTANASFERDKSLDTAIHEVDKKLDKEIEDRIETQLSIVRDQVVTYRHLSSHAVTSNEYPIRTKDFTTNLLTDNLPNAYVFIHGGVSTKPIAKIEKAQYNSESVLTSFTLKAFAFHDETYELTAGGIFAYEFNSVNKQSLKTDVGGYRLTWDVSKSQEIDKLEFILESDNRDGVYSVQNVETGEDVGFINATYGKDDFGNVASCYLQLTSDTTQIFNTTDRIKFTEPIQTVSYTGSDGSNCTIEKNINNGCGFVAKSGYSKTKYIDIVTNDTDDVFARINEDGIIKDVLNTQLLSVVLYYNNNDKTYVLARENRFETHLDGAYRNYLMSLDTNTNVLKVIEEKKWYTYNLNSQLGTITPAKNESYNKKITNTDFETIVVDLRLPISKYVSLNDTYTLTRQTFANTYVCEKFVEDVGSIRITYTRGNIHTVEIKVKTIDESTYSTINTTVDVDSCEIIDNSLIVQESRPFCNDIMNITDDEWSISETQNVKFVFTTDLINKKSAGETRRLISRTSTENLNTIEVVLPDKNADIPFESDMMMAEFILNFNIVSNSEETVNLKFVSATGDNFRLFFLNREYVDKQIPIATNTLVSLKFQELYPNVFIVVDLNDSELNYNVATLSSEVDDVINTVDILSTEISSTIRRNRDDISFFGDVTLSTHYDEHDMHNHISALIATNEKIAADAKFNVYYGFMFRCVTVPGHESEIYELDNEDSPENPRRIKDNTYIVVNKQNNGQAIPLNTLKLSDVAFINNFDLETAELSNYVRQLSNTVELSVEELQKQIISNDNDISFLSGNADDLSAKVESDFVNRLSANTIEGENTFNAKTTIKDEFVEESKIVDLSAEKLEAINSTISNLTVTGIFTATDYQTDARIHTLSTEEATLVNAKISSQVVEKLSVIDDAQISNVTANKLTVNNEEVETLSAANEIVNNLSVDSLTKLSLLDKQVWHRDPEHPEYDHLIGVSSLQDVLDLSTNNLIDNISAVSITLNENLELSVENVSEYVENLELSVKGLSDLVDTKYEQLSNEISSNDTDIENLQNYVSAENGLNDRLTDVEEHYNKAFEETLYTKGGTDISVDVLKVTDSENIENKYTFEFLSGTMVLKVKGE